MGCSSSTLDTEQSVTRCKDRKHFIKLAVQHRHAFAAAHAAYIQSLKKTGATIRQFGEGDTQEREVPSNALNPLYLPPPLPHFYPPQSQVQPSPIGRATSMPPLQVPSHKNTSLTQTSPLGKSPSPKLKVLPSRNPGSSPVRSSSLEEEEEEEEGEGEEEGEDGGEIKPKELYVVADAKPPPPPPSVAATPPPPPPPKASAWEFLDMFPSSTENEELGNKMGSHKIEEKSTSQDEAIAQQAELQEPYKKPNSASKDVPPEFPQVHSKEKATGKNLRRILRELDDTFLAAFESGKVVAKLLEAQKIHYHSNFAEVRHEPLDHSAQVLRVMSWDRNPELPLTTNERIDIFQGKEKETHASTLDKLLAWEKKLHDEVKAGELIRIELERKSMQLRNQKRREENSVTINKTKAIVKSLQTRYLVEIQAVDAAASEVDKLRDDCLYNQLVDLVKGLMDMWNCMLECHQQQYQLIENMGSLDGLYAPIATNDFHLGNTLQLESNINLWHQNFDKLLSTQKDYINAIYHWLRLHIIQIESDGKDMPPSPQYMSTPPVYSLCRAWLAALDQLPGNVTLHALKSFSCLIHELKMQQMEELKQKRKLESLRKELEKKEQSFRMQEVKYNERQLAQPSMESKEDANQENGNAFKERERMLQLSKGTVEMERQKYEHMCSKSGSMTLSSLEKGLPPVLKAIKDFASICSHYYTELYNLTLQTHSQTLQITYE